ncbi:MAG: flavodoxin-dependent (E)-4-hydroxy-3-methylbut-2-enyl-diphosphate synthase [Eubacteriales bacterium]|nr:flavodoxin-dependent (E)-4-hydroxy-3-methylbut-2-enyl-diphosphate synthase [Eubacteriales bacterium]MDD3881336.1 flavodoxin-dependent (E)-4-hydroxy-3-methylbut-2-enyl-diphosphate synthase [Eubacteriales bacterium]MDD4513663.1 flavodoxin-dependent (E)-4-hydroxy-3-methylbut-2-enyl-diphosphate synthase [Eubacteriales bacterium]
MPSKQRITAGGLVIGGGSPIAVQSMTNTDTRDREKTLAQIKELCAAGADLVRFTVPDAEAAASVRYLVDNSPCPLVADIHFDYRLAIASIENGISKLRLNPGNIGSEDRVRMVADCAKRAGVPIRIGVNSGSVQKDILARDGGVTARGLVDSALAHAALLEKCGFHDIVLSMKSSSVPMTVAAYRMAAKACDYPLHVGVTEAGLREEGTLKSAIGIGALLLDGIGDTIRVSLTGSPIPEIKAAKDILAAVGMLPGRIRFVSCPTCGRTKIPVEDIMRRVQAELSGVRKDITVAVMGCVVNGPGEAREADIAIYGGGRADEGVVSFRGEQRRIEGNLAEQFVAFVMECIGKME